MPKLGMDLLLLKRVYTLRKIIFPSWKSITTLLAVAVLVISAIDQVATYYVGVLPKGSFYTKFNTLYMESNVGRENKLFIYENQQCIHKLSFYE